MKLLVFTEGTILQHAEARGLAREEVVRQVQQRQVTAWDFSAYIPVGRAVEKLRAWKQQGAEIAYLTSRAKANEVEQIRNVLKKHGFPDGELFFRHPGEQYRDVAERVIPDILIEDDCESIGGQAQMTYPHISPELKAKVKSIAVKEFGGIDHLPEDIAALAGY